MKKNTSWKFTDESSVTFQSSVSEAGEFGLFKKYIDLSFDKRSFYFSSTATTTIINKRHHSSLLDIWSDKDPELCSCGCDQDLAEDDDDEEEEEDYSEDEDEGCFVITSVPQSNEPEEVTNKVTWQ